MLCPNCGNVIDEADALGERFTFCKECGVRLEGSSLGTPTVVSSVASHLTSVFPKSSFGVYSRIADVIHVGWEGPPETGEVRLSLQMLRSTRQIPDVRFDFHHNVPEESPGATVLPAKEEYLSSTEQILKGQGILLAESQEVVNKLLHACAGVKDEAAQRLLQNLEQSVTEVKKSLDAAWENYGKMKKGGAETFAPLLAEMRQILEQNITDATLFKSATEEWNKSANARINATKDEAIQVLRQLDYASTEAKKAVDAAWEKHGPMATAAEVVKKVFESRPSR